MRRNVGETCNHNEVRANGVILAMRCDLHGRNLSESAETFHSFTLPGQESNVILHLEIPARS